MACGNRKPVGSVVSGVATIRRGAWTGLSGRLSIRKPRLDVRLRCRLLASAVSVLVAASCASGGSPPKLATATERNQGVGQRLARSMLARVVPPEGSSPTNRVLSRWAARPPMTEGTSDLIDQSKLWLIPLGADDAMSFLRRHDPVGLRPTGQSDGVTVTLQQLDLVLRPPGISSAALYETVAALSSSRSELRLDVQVVWIPQRPAIEEIPATPRW